MSKWVEFILASHQPPKTQRWEVRAIAGGYWLGDVVWYGAWRRYVLKAAAAGIFDPECLRDIAAFCEEHTRARRVPG